MKNFNFNVNKALTILIIENCYFFQFQFLMKNKIQVLAKTIVLANYDPAVLTNQTIPTCRL